MKRLALGSVLAASLSVAAFAQGPLKSNLPIPNGARMPNGDDAPYAFKLTGRISQVDADRKEIVVRRPDGRSFKYVVGDKARLRADKDTELAGRSSVSLADYRPGQTVTVTSRASDGRVLELRLRRPQG